MTAMNEIVVYLIQTLLSLFLLAVLLRFLLQLVRADFYNPISQFLAKVTNPIILPLRKIMPSYASLDLSSLLVALLLQLAGIVTVLFLNGIAIPAIPQLLVWSALGIIGLLVNIYFFALLAMIILSWIAPSSKNAAVFLLYQITEPVMAPLRKIIPSMGGLDFSPILVFIVINVIQIVLRHIANSAGLYPGLVFGL
ncbi:MAG: YggT family protein [Halioglobus sp.]|nr:YggT family protein [Halioglobus sp.]